MPLNSKLPPMSGASYQGQGEPSAAPDCDKHTPFQTLHAVRRGRTSAVRLGSAGAARPWRSDARGMDVVGNRLDPGQCPWMDERAPRAPPVLSTSRDRSGRLAQAMCWLSSGINRPCCPQPRAALRVPFENVKQCCVVPAMPNYEDDAPIAGEPGLTAYECPKCQYVASVLQQPMMVVSISDSSFPDRCSGCSLRRQKTTRSSMAATSHRAPPTWAMSSPSGIRVQDR
jgi:hypothetical protein